MFANVAVYKVSVYVSALLLPKLILYIFRHRLLYLLRLFRDWNLTLVMQTVKFLLRNSLLV